MTAKRTKNPTFGTPLRASCLALESAQREHTKSLDISCFLWADLREGRVLGTCRWHVFRTVGFAKRNLSGRFFAKNQVWLYQSSLAKNFADKICQANFIGKFASELFRQRTPPEHNAIVVLAVKFWVIVPENLRTQKKASRHGHAHRIKTRDHKIESTCKNGISHKFHSADGP